MAYRPKQKAKTTDTKASMFNRFIPKSRQMKIYALVLAAIFLFYLYVLDDYGLINLIKKEIDLRNVNNRIESLKADKTEYAHRLELLKRNDKSIIEKIAREEYGMVRKGEQLFKIQYGGQSPEDKQVQK